jgi:hypothetical protein
VSCRIGRYPVGSKLRIPVVQKELVEAPSVRNLKYLRAGHDEAYSVDLLIDWRSRTTKGRKLALQSCDALTIHVDAPNQRSL